MEIMLNLPLKKRQEMGRQSRQLAEDYFDEKIVIEKYFASLSAYFIESYSR